MKFAVIKTGGKQYKVQEGKSLKVEKLEAQMGEKIAFDKVLLFYNEQEGLKVGKPFLSDIKVTGEIVEQKKGPKIVIFKYRPKTRYRKKTGHRQPYTLLMVTNIGNGQEEKKERKKVEAAKKKTAAKRAEKTENEKTRVVKKSKKVREAVDKKYNF